MLAPVYGIQSAKIPSIQDSKRFGTGSTLRGLPLDPFPSIVPDDDEKYPVPGMRGYSPDKFYTRGSDRRGHCKEYRVTLSQDWPPLLAAIVETIPEYDSMAGLIRDAVFHRA